MNCYITTNEIPGELLRENLILIFRLVKITVAMATTRKAVKTYRCIINRTFHGQMMSKRNILVSHWCLCKKQNNTWPLGDTKFLFELSRIFHSST